MLRILFAIGPVALIVAAIGVWAEASDLPVAQRVAAEICRDPEITADGLGARFQPRREGTQWQRVRDEQPARWLHRRFLGNASYRYWIVAKSRSDGIRLSRVWVDIGTRDDRDEIVTLASASFDGDCRLLAAHSY